MASSTKLLRFRINGTIIQAKTNDYSYKVTGQNITIVVDQTGKKMHSTSEAQAGEIKVMVSATASAKNEIYRNIEDVTILMEFEDGTNVQGSNMDSMEQPETTATDGTIPLTFGGDVTVNTNV